MSAAQREPKVVVLGGGSWGTTVASICARRRPTLQRRRSAETAADVNENHRNSAYLGDEAWTFPFGAADPHGLVGESPAAWALRDRIAALEASKAQPVVNVTDLHNDMAKLAQPMSLGEVAWPKGSLQWAEVEAKRMGLTRVHRKGWTYSLSIEMSMVLDVEDHLALDWEPCE